MKFKSFLSLALVLVLIFAISGCKKNPQDTTSENTNTKEENTEIDTITLLYSSGDSFNPYALKTNINRQLVSLLYEPLVKLSNEFEPIYSVAESVELSGKNCVVKIKDIVFSDSSSVTVDDIIYSYNLAKSSLSGYAAKLYEVSSVAVLDRKTIQFNLTKADPYFVNLLDFPIIKSGSDKITNSDGEAQPPISCGRYIVSADNSSFEINPNYYGKKGSIKKIRLINSPDSESVAHFGQIGAADMYYSDISDGNILRISGKKYNVNINNLVYIGVNHNVAPLAQKEIRQAISSGIDRSKIVKESYFDNAVAATGFFNPNWKAVKSVQNLEITANKKITIENLKQIGYNNVDNRGIRINSNGSYLNFSLLVNSENRTRVSAAQNIASQLLECGIRVTVVEKRFDEYLACLQNGQFELYLGEVKLTDNMDISCLVTEGGSSAYGLNTQVDNLDPEFSQPPVENDLSVIRTGRVVEKFYEGENTINDIASVLQSDMPFIPVCYRTGILFCNDRIDNISSFSAGDIFTSIDSYKLKQ